MNPPCVEEDCCSALYNSKACFERTPLTSRLCGDCHTELEAVYENCEGQNNLIGSSIMVSCLGVIDGQTAACPNGVVQCELAWGSYYEYTCGWEHDSTQTWAVITDNDGALTRHFNQWGCNNLTAPYSG